MTTPTETTPADPIVQRILDAIDAGATRDQLAPLYDELHAAYLAAPRGGTTTSQKLPYPDPTDPVANGANAIRALAEAVDAHGVKVYHGDPISATIASGGGSVQYVNPITVAAATFPRVLVVSFRGMCSTLGAGTADFQLRQPGQIGGTLVQFARVNAVNVTGSGLYVYNLAANVSTSFNVLFASSVAATAPNDNRFGGMDITAYPTTP